MGELDAAGEIVTGGLLGRAVEPHAGEGEGGDAPLCLNCGTALIGPHCHSCGQTGHVHRTLGAIGHEILHGVAHFEGKLWRTLPLLAWRPGELTRRYITGERARFVSPMAIFLFSIFAMFAVFSAAGISASPDLSPNVQLDTGLKKARENLIEERADLVKGRDARAQGDPKRARAEADIARVDQQLKAVSRTLTDLGEVGVSSVTNHEFHTGWHMLDHGIEKWQKNPSLMLYKLQASSYKFSWLLIPLSLPFVWLLFAWRREFPAYDHMVFVTYSIAFMSLLFIALTIASALGLGGLWIAVGATSVPIWHIHRQLKGAYGLGRVSAVLRTIALLVFIVLVLILFLLALLALGMLG